MVSASKGRGWVSRESGGRRGHGSGRVIVVRNGRGVLRLFAFVVV